MDPKLRTLSSQPLFAGLGRAELRQLMRYVDEVELAPGDVLTWPGWRMAGLYLVLDGEVAVEAGGRPATVRAGGWLGERALLDGGQETARAVATTAGRALVVSRAQFRGLQTHPVVMDRLQAGPAAHGGACALATAGGMAAG